MNAKSYFVRLSILILIFNILTGVGAIVLIERIVPAIDNILKENAFSASAATNMLKLITSSQDNKKQVASTEVESLFWLEFHKVKSNITLPEENELIDRIEVLARAFWLGDLTQGLNLADSIYKLAAINMLAMKSKAKEAQTLSLAGAWGVGLLLAISILIQLYIRARTLSMLIDPIDQLTMVLRDFQSGNLQRRSFNDPHAISSIKTAGALVNDLLDQVVKLKSDLKGYKNR